jgi:hypothetical protein
MTRRYLSELGGHVRIRTLDGILLLYRIGILERSWDTGDSPLSKCGVEPVLSLLLPLALISSCICFFTSFVTIVIAQLVECWLDILQITGSNPDKFFYYFRLENLKVQLLRFVPLWMQLATPAV